MSLDPSQRINNPNYTDDKGLQRERQEIPPERLDEVSSALSNKGNRDTTQKIIGILKYIDQYNPEEVKQWTQSMLRKSHVALASSDFVVGLCQIRMERAGWGNFGSYDGFKELCGEDVSLDAVTKGLKAADTLIRCLNEVATTNQHINEVRDLAEECFAIAPERVCETFDKILPLAKFCDQFPSKAFWNLFSQALGSESVPKCILSIFNGINDFSQASELASRISRDPSIPSSDYHYISEAFYYLYGNTFPQRRSNEHLIFKGSGPQKYLLDLITLEELGASTSVVSNSDLALASRFRNEEKFRSVLKLVIGSQNAPGYSGAVERLASYPGYDRDEDGYGNDSLPVTLYENDRKGRLTERAKEMYRQIWEVYHRAFDLHEGFSALSPLCRHRADGGASIMERYGNFAMDRQRFLNSSSNDIFPGKGFVHEGLRLRRFFRFHKGESSLEVAAPWLANEIPDVFGMRLIRCRFFIAITPPKISKYHAWGGHYSIVAFNDHTKNPLKLGVFAIPTAAIPELQGILNETMAFNPNRTSAHELKMRILELFAESKRRGASRL